jgi:hypothetical protein
MLTGNSRLDIGDANREGLGHDAGHRVHVVLATGSMRV